MIYGLSHLLLIAFAYFLIALADMTFQSEYYYQVNAVAFSFITVCAAFIAVQMRSRLTMVYATVCLVSAVFMFYMTADAGFYALEWIYWDATLNYCLIMQTLELAIITRGGINVICSLLSLRSSSSSGNNSGNAWLVNFV